MSEPKVVHEWDSGETEYKLYDDGSLSWEQIDIGSRSFSSGTLTTSIPMREMARLAARVKALLDARQADCENIQRHMAENQRLREASALAIRKAEQYWNEHNIPDAETHAALEIIHSALSAALKEKP